MQSIIPLILIVASSTFAQTRSDSTAIEFRRIEQTAFGLGERLVYDIGYSFVTAGEAVFAIPAMDTVNGRLAYRIEFSVQSTPSFSWIYKVDDLYRTIVDESALMPWRFTQRIREGSYSRDFEAEFDHYQGVARTKDGVYPIPPHVQDVVSALYLARTFDFGNMRPGQRTELQNFYKDSAYTLAVRFLGFQKVSVDAGTFDCFLIEPLIKEGGLFKSDGRILIWLSNDDRRIPVKVTTKVAIGSIDAELREYKGLRGPLKARIK
ncbi:MAG: DUF3108 domain-containing protein [Bacteroidetes bacterium]|jgi:hypothetical protein|nr:DUF3108 domain-containing protein [Bacteroidota bacterium]